MQTITEKQYNSLSVLIFDTLRIGKETDTDDFIICEDEANTIVDKWMQECIILFEPVDKETNICIKQVNELDGRIWFGVWINGSFENNFSTLESAEKYYNNIVGSMKLNPDRYTILKQINI
jgi:hypothetical protein